MLVNPGTEIKTLDAGPRGDTGDREGARSALQPTTLLALVFGAAAVIAGGCRVYSLPHQPDDVEVPLQDIIESCETFELAHIRKQATDSIEELRRKGSEASRNFAWWGQAGQTALSLGCVAAAVGGQATAEIPCVVGSAMSTAGLKYLAPSP
jgi:hypothetical protein